MKKWNYIILGLVFSILLQSCDALKEKKETEALLTCMSIKDAITSPYVSKHFLFSNIQVLDWKDISGGYMQVHCSADVSDAENPQDKANSKYKALWNKNTDIVTFDSDNSE